MNAAEMHLDFKEYIDEFTTGDVDEVAINRFLRWAVEDIVDERFGPEDSRKRYKGLEKTQKVKSDLRTLLVKDSAVAGNLTVSSNICTYPSDYRYMARVSALLRNPKVTIDVWRYGLRPATQNYLSGNLDSELLNKSLYYEPVYSENADGIEIYAGQYKQTDVTVQDVELRYIKNPVAPVKSASFTSSQVMVVGQLIHVDSGSVVYNSVTYNALETFTVVIGFTQFTGSGTASVIVNTDLPNQVHLEVVRRAAMIYEGIMLEREERGSIAEDEMNA